MIICDQKGHQCQTMKKIVIVMVALVTNRVTNTSNSNGVLPVCQACVVRIQQDNLLGR